MTADVATKRAVFRELHREGCFVLPNAWDVGSTVRLVRAGFKAIASTSSGAAWAMGREDGELSRDTILVHLRMLCSSTDLPINADFEAGFADDPAGVGANVELAVATGVAGLSIEDRTGRELYEPALAVERIRAAREAIDRTGEDALLVARSEGFLIGRTQVDATIARLTAYADAGADCLYAPGVNDIAAIREIVAAVAPKPVNALLIKPEMRVADLAAAGVRRVSVGGGLAAAAWKGFDQALRMLVEDGRIPPR
ncbi:2-methylisocitrate lyase [Edaphobacter acidisoli]|uniref:2-methylisocitrate lyase n=1 Tax=Edaphobacter acidisoli TaxID=2040573 RepID=A0A916W8L5_9BACT|nr:isocitrate lyase/phosphoenolpyruvate mutase family protein [Edaphobacter acidisoli]GGA76232.1 2-methylisocitrate lyase [Edaphobacter acidisoli]